MNEIMAELKQEAVWLSCN